MPPFDIRSDWCQNFIYTNNRRHPAATKSSLIRWGNESTEADAELSWKVTSCEQNKGKDLAAFKTKWALNVA